MLKSLPELIAQARAKLRCLEAAAALAEAAENNGLVIDVREAAEVEQTPVAGSHNLPRSMLEMKIVEQVRDAQQPLYLHCASGARATLAAEQLQRLGYQQVTVITCPIDQIQRALANS